MDSVVIPSFVALTATALLIRRFGKSHDEKSNSNSQATATEVHARFRKLQLKYFAAYFPAIMGDWLQGPYIYQLYSYYGFKESHIALLFLTGFASSSTFGTFTGPLADKFGRRKLTLVFAVLYGFCCLIKFSPNFWVLLSGRLIGGISTSLLFSVFESWYVRQHVDVEKLPSDLLADTFATSTFANGLIAIVAGILANFLAENLALGPMAPFALAIPCFMICFFVVLVTWDENFGDTKVDLVSSYREGALLIWRNRPVFLIGLVQSIIESCMYIFVFLWTPVLSNGAPAPLGMIFSCFMVCIMIGSGVFTLLLNKSSYQPGETLQLAASIFAGTTFVCSLSASPKSTTGLRLVSFFSFLLLETSIGLYFPSIGCLRSELIPESHRATVTNWFRVPMNLITCFTLLAVNHPAVASDKRSIFATCTALLITGVLIASKFNAWHRSLKPQINEKKAE